MAGVEVRWADKHLQHYAELLEQVYRENPVVRANGRQDPLMLNCSQR